MKYCLVRQDDNGNVFLVKKSNDKLELLVLKAKLEVKDHKQIYWIEEAA